MPLTRIRQTAIGDDSITSPKLAHDLDFDGQFVRVPHGTTAQRPSSPAAGYMRFNTTIGTLEQWNTATNSWQAIDSPPIITSIAYASSRTAADPAGSETITVNGSNFKTGATVTIGGTSATSVSFVSSTQITFTTPAKTAGDYDVVVTNTNGLAATATNGISYNGVPAFSTAAGNVGSINGGVVMSTITIVAAETDSGAISYSVTSGSLPSGTALSSAGAITGTPASPTNNTTFNFSVTATDDENQTTARAFNLIVLRQIYSYPITKSLKFNVSSSECLTRTGGDSGNRSTFTFSGWIKRSNLCNGGTNQAIFGGGTDSANRDVLRFSGDDELEYQNVISGVSLSVKTEALFRDVTAWMHIVLRVDTTQSDSANRVKIYVNGVQQTLTGNTANWHAQNSVTHFTHSNLRVLGARTSTGSNQDLFFDGYMAEVHLIDGTSLAPTSFASEYYKTWSPKAYNTSDGGYGSVGFHLDFADGAAIGDDNSGQTHDWTPVNLAATDVMLDSPTNNFATINALTMGQNNGISNGALKVQSVWSADLSGANMTQFLQSGKWYWEVRPANVGSTYPYIGISTWAATMKAASYGSRYTIAWGKAGAAVEAYTQMGTITKSNVAAWNNGNIIMIAVDVDARKIWWGVNGVWQGGANPSGGSGQSASWTVHQEISPNYMGYSGQGAATMFNFGQDSTFNGQVSAATNADGNGIGNFQHSPPTGFLAICSKNIAESAVNVSVDDQPEDYMDTTLHVGNGGSQTISDLTFRPDLVWIKDRTTNYHHQLYDSVRGATKKVSTSIASAESTDATALTAFTDTGFTLGSNVGVNDNSSNYVAWSWKAGGAPTATNTAGTGAVPTAGSVKVDGANRTSAFPTSGSTMDIKKMSVNTKAGFSIIHYIGTGGNKNMPHGLSKRPDMFWIKDLDQGYNWAIWHQDLDGGDYSLRLPPTAGQSNAYDYWNGDMTDTYIQLGAGDGVAKNTSRHICYAWTSIPGYSKMGTYLGNANTGDWGPYVHLGFRPSFVMIKAIATTESWYSYDNTTNTDSTSNPHNTYFNPSHNGLGATNLTSNRFVDFLSNGFKVRGGDSSVNHNNSNLVYMAFAESPFKYSEAE